MKKILAAEAIMIASSLLFVGCSAVFDELKSGVDTVIDESSDILGQYRTELEGEIITKELVPEDGEDITSVSINKLSFYSNEGSDPVIKIVPSDENKVVLKYQSDLSKNGISFGVADGEFFLEAEHALRVSTDCFEAVIYANIETVDISGGIKISADGICQDSLYITVAGAVDADFSNTDVDALYISVAGAGEFHLSGKADSLLVKFDSAGDLDAKELAAKEADIIVNGAGSVEVSCSEKLTAAIRGAGNLEYYGNPSTSFSGGGLAAIEQKSTEIYSK